jgi:hypothetical protein
MGHPHAANIIVPLQARDKTGEHSSTRIIGVVRGLVRDMPPIKHCYSEIMCDGVIWGMYGSPAFQLVILRNSFRQAGRRVFVFLDTLRSIRSLRHPTRLIDGIFCVVRRSPQAQQVKPNVAFPSTLDGTS